MKKYGKRLRLSQEEVEMVYENRAESTTNLNGNNLESIIESRTRLVKTTSAVGIKNFLSSSFSNLISNWSSSNLGNWPVPNITFSLTNSGGETSL